MFIINMKTNTLSEIEFVINDSVAYLNSLDKRKNEPSIDTKKQYRQIVHRLNRIKKNPLEHCTTKNTFYLYRAAWAYVLTTEIDRSLKCLKLVRNDDELIRMVNDIGENLKKLKMFPPDSNLKNIERSELGLYDSPWQAVKHLSPCSKSKKGQTIKLPCGWQEKIFQQAIKQNSKYLDAIAVLSISGCRPSEIENGVRLQLQNDLSIKVIIRSRKTHEGKYGQEIRSFIINSDSVEHSYLTSKIRSNNGVLFVSVKKSKNLSEAIRKLSKTVFTMSDWNISPYNYRHAFCSNLKGAKKTREEVAKALGHSNDISQRFYLSGKTTKGGFCIKEIVGTNQVNVTGPEGEQALANISRLQNLKNERSLNH